MLILTVLLLSTKVFSQNKGLYLSGKDFTEQKIAHASRNTRIRSHELFNRTIVEVKCNDSLFSYEKAKVFGYANKDGVYRFVNNDAYTILNPGEKILLYKKTTGTGFKNSPIVDTYYFSKDAYSPVQLLNLRNLLATFSDNVKFSEMIEIYFTKQSDLLEYDDIHQAYKINRLLQIAYNK